MRHSIGFCVLLACAAYAAHVAAANLRVMNVGLGAGSVASSPSGINCGTTCDATFAAGASVTLTATPASGSAFVGWDGDCTGNRGVLAHHDGR